MPPKKTDAKWEWMNDGGTFADFDTTANRLIEAAFSKALGKGKANMDVNGWKYEFDFDAMKQTNCETKKVRKINRTGPPIISTTTDAAVWQWKNDRGAWENFSTELSNSVEDEYQKAAGLAATFTMKIAGRDYTIDLGAMKQINDATKFSRDIRRIGGAAVERPRKKIRLEEITGRSSGLGGQQGPLKMVKKGRGVVDPHSGMAETAHVYETPKIVYQCMLNQTNIAQNNNKFYVLQLLESDKGGDFYLWTRWGRVGVVGQSALDHCSGLPAGIALFCKKFRDKTSNEWTGDAEDFEKVDGKYQLMQMDYGDEPTTTATTSAAVAAAAATASIASALPASLQNFMKMIGSTTDMERAMKELEVDTAKMPLGKISKKQVKDGFKLLKEIEDELKKRGRGPNRKTLVDKTSLFYTLIPHDFGFSHPPIIDDLVVLKKKMDLLEVLSDLEVATKLLLDAKAIHKNPLDASYEQLKCEIIPLNSTDETHRRIVQFVANTHGKTHTAYRLEVLEIFKVNRSTETEKYARFATLGNRQMLWHGSRTTNFLGILSQGLRIAPPEAPVTGYMFGKGIYLADVASKSGNYCHTSPTNNEGVLLLCEAALGKTLDLTEAKYMDHPAGFNSTKGVGKMEPNEAEAVVVDGVKWPMGRMVDSGVTRTALLYHEYVVYDVAQIQMKFIVKCKFKYR